MEEFYVCVHSHFDLPLLWKSISANAGRCTGLRPGEEEVGEMSHWLIEQFFIRKSAQFKYELKRHFFSMSGADKSSSLTGCPSPGVGNVNQIFASDEKKIVCEL